MKNRQQWRPSKYVIRNGRLVGSRKQDDLTVGSRLFADRVAARYQDACRIHARGRLLDLGCGRVPLYEAYSAYVEEITCLDWPNSVHDILHIDLACDLNQPIPLPSASFETIVISDVLEHLAEPNAVCSEMSRLLSPGGKILMNVPYLFWIHEEPHDFYRYPEFGLRYLANKAGLKPLTVEPVGGPFEVMADILAKITQPVPLLGKPLAITTQVLASGVAALIAHTKFSPKLAAKFPLGYFLILEKAAHL